MLRTGRRIAIDVGTKRIGVAASDFHGILASPLATIDGQLAVEEILRQIQQLVDEQILEFYVGQPVGLSGNETESTRLALRFGKQLAAITAVPVLLVDERLTTSIANSQLKEIGKSQRDARATIDQMAAVAILEHALSEERNTGQRPGKQILESEE